MSLSIDTFDRCFTTGYDKNNCIRGLNLMYWLCVYKSKAPLSTYIILMTIEYYVFVIVMNNFVFGYGRFNNIQLLGPFLKISTRVSSSKKEEEESKYL